MTEEAVKSFDDVKTALVSATLFAHPRADAQLTPMTDAYGTAVGASPQKTVNGFLQPLAFFSNNLRPAETHYSAFGHEFFAVYLSIRHFQHFLEGREFVVLTGHSDLPPISLYLPSRLPFPSSPPPPSSYSSSAD
nr:unnamed protein product [Spirometra erinaceieuropaei]